MSESLAKHIEALNVKRREAQQAMQEMMLRGVDPENEGKARIAAAVAVLGVSIEHLLEYLDVLLGLSGIEDVAAAMQDDGCTDSR